MGIPNKWRLSSLYTKLLLTFTITVTLLIIGLSTLLYRNYSQSSIDNVTRTNTALLHQISYSANYMDNTAQKFISTVIAEPRVTNLFFYPDKDMILLDNAFKYLNLLVTTNDYIFSAYTISFPLDRIVSTENGAFYSVGDFYDSQAVDFVRNWDESNPVSMPVARTIPSVSATSGLADVYTYVVPYQPRSGEQLQTALVVNIKAEVLRALIASLNTQASDFGSDIFVMDEKGVVVNHPTEGMIGQNLETEAYVRKILSSDQAAGNFKTNIDSQSFNVTYVSSNKLKWKFVSLTSYGTFMSPVNAVKSSTMLISVAVLLLGLIFSFMMSKSLYSPVRRLVDSVRLKGDELDKKQREHRQALKGNWLREMILGSKEIGQKEFLAQKTELGIRAELTGSIQMILFRIDNYKSFTESYKQGDRRLLKFAIANIIEDLVSVRFKGDVIDMDADRLILLLDVDDSDENETTLKALVHDIQRAVNEYLRLSVSAAIGKLTDSRLGLGEVYSDMLALSMYRLFAGKGSVLTPSFLLTIDSNPLPIPESKTKLLLDSLKLGHLEKAKGYYDEMMDGLIGSSYETALSSIMHLMFKIRGAFPSIAANGNTRVGELFQAFFVGIDSIESMEEIRRMFEAIFEEIVATADTNKQNKRHMIVSRIKELIEEQYRDPNLNLSLLAEEFQMSHVYLGRMFKEATGRSVVEHITEVRMGHVKRLLEETSLSTKEIVEQCGWEDSNYFYILFKKHFGIPLSQYRLTKKFDDEKS
ncbi:helix-turn-helix domain-containing protein [Cohnella soli]|uniref:Helix-turn-helix domain-containing protein n=1 Tax=Cohnella soli TaxID=425005 RepID=A0ABW0HSJ0_9BACL